MGDQDKPWWDDDDLWEACAPLLFTEERWNAAPLEVDRVLELAPVSEGAAVLDMSCGVGRHSLELARRGFRVTGVDRTLSYVREAERRAAAEELQVTFVCSDMGKYRHGPDVDLVLSMFTSFGYLEDPADNLAVLSNLRGALRPGGKLVVDVMGAEVIAAKFRPRDWQELPGGGFWLQERAPAEDWTRMENRWVLVRDGEVKTFLLGHHVYSGATLREMMLRAGFDQVQLFGGLDGRPYDHQAKRLVAVASVTAPS